MFMVLMSAWSMAWGQSQNLRPEPVLVRGSNLALHGFRYLNSQGQYNSGPWIVFLHGLGSNLHEFEYVIPHFVEQGYDCFAFNWRGHGNGDEQSLVLNYHEGDYEFAKMVDEDFSLLLEFIRAKTKTDGFVFGHSMGGMVPRAAFGRLTQGLARQVKAMVLLGSPPHFHSAEGLRRVLDPFHLVYRLENFLLSGSGNDRIEVGRFMVSSSRTLDFLNFWNPGYWVAKSLYKWLSSGLLKVGFDLRTPEEVSWMRRAVTDRLPKDILRSFSRFSNGNYPYEAVSVPVPILHIVGDRDTLVLAKDVAEHAKRQSHTAGAWLVLMKGVGHMGLVGPRVFRGYEAYVQQFLTDPQQLGEPNKNFIEASPAPPCELLLAKAG
jgi:pimeloyl-ACP methyl ester carboxylesterase